MRKKTPQPCDAESLRHWKEKGVESVVLDARLQFMDAEGIARDFKVTLPGKQNYVIESHLFEKGEAQVWHFTT